MYHNYSKEPPKSYIVIIRTLQYLGERHGIVERSDLGFQCIDFNVLLPPLSSFLVKREP